MARKDDVRKRIEGVLDRWRVKPHCVHIKDRPGAFDVTILVGGDKTTSTVTTRGSQYLISLGLQSLELMIRARNDARDQFDLEDY